MYYALRFQVLPGSRARDDARELAAFCLRHGIGEAVLFVAGEELHDGHLTAEEADSWYAAVATAVDVLREAGVGVSLNPWVTTGHADRGRVDRHGFAPMVGPFGDVATAQASFACPRWRAWLAAHYGRFADLGLRVLWLEDDFRFHNHAPLIWGGGFEPGMLARFAELAGEPVDRADLVAAITAPGEPHPWRALLQRTWRETQLEVVAQVRAAVAGRAALGLMSSTLGVASVEGRDWRALFTALGPGAVHRPHYAPYVDAPAHSLAWSVAMLELQRPLRPHGIEIAPEVENYPYTHWAKSDTQTWSELVACALSGVDGLLLNVLPFTARTPATFERVGDLLDRARPALDRVADTEVETIGVGIPWYADTAAHVRTERASLEALDIDPTRAARYLLSYGVPVRAGESPVVALFGDLAWAVPDEELAQFLTGGLLLDGTAAAILAARGHSASIGVLVHDVQGREEHTEHGPYAMERVTEAAEVVAAGTLYPDNQQPAVARMTALPGATVWTEVRTPRQEAWGDGLVLFTNPSGGRVAVLAATVPEDLPRSDTQQRLLHAVIRFLEGGRRVFPLVTGGAHLIPHAARTSRGLRLAVANGSADPAVPVLDLPPDWPAPEVTTVLAPLSAPETGSEVPHRGYLLVEWPSV
ncbi:hypothetical protein [Actinokineospora sp. NBRC 105648]|uniref:hypothetical protein n=1 Tax=Actinokineospora sp. NBRC 105648 TaxID=3032206 RepID=UPI0024A0D22D|nr:hypothetical protein [Actinokineospora sp. NBRC 105648]GLZ41066.1 hypothetical protein Acsp05_46900 [Actinokineospora sp. NBRC 105648]